MIAMSWVRHLRLIACCIALALLAACAGLSPQQDIAALMRQGQEHYAAKRYDDAIKTFDEVVARDAAHAQAHLWLAKAYIAKGQWREAIARARRAHELSPEEQDVTPVYAEALMGGGTQALGAGNFKDAVSHFSDYIKLQPGNARAYLNVARALLGDKRFAEALAALIKLAAIASGAERADALAALIQGGLQALVQGDYRSAIGFFSEYLKIDPANLRIYIELAKAFLLSGDYSSALSTFVSGLQQGGQREEVLQALAEAGRQALASGRTREAVAFLREYINYDRANLNAYLDLAKSYLQSGDRANALNAFRRALELNPRNEEAMRFLRGG